MGATVVCAEAINDGGITTVAASWSMTKVVEVIAFAVKPVLLVAVPAAIVKPRVPFPLMFDKRTVQETVAPTAMLVNWHGSVVRTDFVAVTPVPFMVTSDARKVTSSALE